MIAQDTGQQGLVVWGANPLKKVYWDDRPDTVLPRPLTMVAAQGETVHLHVALRSPVPQADIRIDVPGLASDEGARISCPRVRWVENVSMNHYTICAGIPPDVERRAPALYPDPLIERETGFLYANQSRSVYLAFAVAPDQPEGVYRGQVHVTTPTDACELPLEIEVVDYQISPHSHLLMTNWQMAPKAQARYFGYEVCSPRFWRYVEAMADDMVRHRSTVFLVNYYELVRGIRRGEDDFTWDFRDFDRYVEAFLDRGAQVIEGRHVFTSISRDRASTGWQSRDDLEIRWTRSEMDGASHPFMPARPAFPGEAFEKRVGSLLGALDQHLLERGWKDKFILHVMDEPPLEYVDLYRQGRDFVKQHMPGVATIDAVHRCDLRLGLEDRYVGLLHHWNDAFRERLRQGAKDWWYVCWGPRGGGYPNRFLDYPLLDTRILFWLSYKEGVEGFLHWGYNRYYNQLYYIPEPRDPFTVPDMEFTGAGDPMVVYPGEGDTIISSLRWEQTLEGQQDYEHLLRLAQIGEERGDEAAQQVLNEVLDTCCPSLTGYVRDPEVLLQNRERVLRTIERLLKS